MTTIANDTGCHLDPQPEPRLPFQKQGRRWTLGGRPTRLPAMVIDDGHGIRIEVLDLQTGSWRTEVAA